MGTECEPCPLIGVPVSAADGEPVGDPGTVPPLAERYEPTFETSVRMTGTEQTRRCEYYSADPLLFELSIQNVTDSSTALGFTSSKVYDFYVLDCSGTILWRWSHGRGFTDEREILFFEPGEIKTFSTVWPQIDNEGRPLQPGRYEMIGTVDGRHIIPDDLRQTTQQRAAPVSFWILR